MANVLQGQPVTQPSTVGNSWSDTVSQGSTQSSGNSSNASSGSSFSSTNLPGWYKDYMQGLTGAAVDVGMNTFKNAPVPHQQQAGLQPGQTAAMTGVTAAQGNWRPGMDRAGAHLGNAVPVTDSYVQNAMGAVQGPARGWTSEYPQYMSPYTMNVVDNISRLGQRNFAEKLTPEVNNAFIGAGQFGSTRNAEVLGRVARDVSADITGKQAEYMDQNYRVASDIFGKDADRTQRQQQMQSGTALNAGALMRDTMFGASDREAKLAELLQQLTGRDNQATMAVGDKQQSQAQGALDLLYKNAQADRQAPLDLVSWAKSIIAGIGAPSESGSNQSSSGSSSQSSTSNNMSVSSSDNNSVRPGDTTFTSSPAAGVLAATKLWTSQPKD